MNQIIICRVILLQCVVELRKAPFKKMYKHETCILGCVV